MKQPITQKDIDDLKMSIKEKSANLYKVAARFFSSEIHPNRYLWDEKRLQQYTCLSNAFFKLYATFNAPESLFGKDDSIEKKHQIFTALNQSVVDTASLLEKLSIPPTNDANENQKNQQQKTQALREYQKKYQQQKKPAILRKFTQAAIGLCSALIGFVLGAVVTGFFSPTPPTILVGGLFGAAIGFHIASRYKVPKQESPSQMLHNKAAKFGEKAHLFFQAEKKINQKKTMISSTSEVKPMAVTQTMADTYPIEYTLALKG